MKERNLLDEDNTTEVIADPVPKLHLIGGGKDDNWLMQLKEGTVFLAKEHFVTSPAMKVDRQAELPMFTLVHKKKKAALIVVEMGPQKMESWVHALIFSRKYQHIETLLEPTEEGPWVT